MEFHRAVKIQPGAAGLPEQRNLGDRVFADLPKIALPSTFTDATTPTLSLLENGCDAVGESAPQTLKTVATWLHLCASLLKSLASCEIYLAVFAIDGIEPGLHHFAPREFSLHKLRSGIEALSL